MMPKKVTNFQQKNDKIKRRNDFDGRLQQHINFQDLIDYFLVKNGNIEFLVFTQSAGPLKYWLKYFWPNIKFSFIHQWASEWGMANGGTRHMRAQKRVPTCTHLPHDPMCPMCPNEVFGLQIA